MAGLLEINSKKIEHLSKPNSSSITQKNNSILYFIYKYSIKLNMMIIGSLLQSQLKSYSHSWGGGGGGGMLEITNHMKELYFKIEAFIYRIITNHN